MIDKRWVLHEADEDQVVLLQKELKIHPILCRLLVRRGIRTYEDARMFFRPAIEDLHDPFLMKDMNKAVERIQKAINNNENILIYGDYDVDGTTSVALVYSFLKDFYANIGYYIPDRYKEGYGISYQGIDFAKENNFSLIIALDCGIKAVEKVKYANEKGVDFIICDHHLPGDELPPAYAVLDPKQEDCEYPYKELSGCAIGFKLIQAFAEHNSIPFEVLEKQLDLVAVSIASDIVPITGENRVLTFFGLKRLNEDPRPGLKSLIQASSINRELSITDIVFVIGPRINAAGRMDSARNAVDLLVSDISKTAEDGADHLDKKNTLRKEVDKSITEEALNIIIKNPELISRKTTVLFQPHWHKGVIGIVASRLIETYYRPTIILTESNGFATGSARSVRGFSIYEAIKACEHLLEQFGGHKYAAGLTMKVENVEAFQEKFEQVVSETIDEQLLIPEVDIDAELNFVDINEKFFKVVQQFAPFGPGNMKPVFISKACRDKGYTRVVGGSHLKLHLTQDGGRSCKGIAFGLGSFMEKIQCSEEAIRQFDICYTLSENEWQGYRNIELNVKDIKVPG